MKDVVPFNQEDKKLFDDIFESFKKKYNIYEPSDLIQLNMLCSDIVRLKKAYSKMDGQVIAKRNKNGRLKKDVSPIAYYINQIEGQIRSSLREMKLTRKSRPQKEEDDFTTIINKVIDVEEKDEKHKEIKK